MGELEIILLTICARQLTVLFLVKINAAGAEVPIGWITQCYFAGAARFWRVFLS